MQIVDDHTWIDGYEYLLSVRAVNVLRNAHLTGQEFLALEYGEIAALRNCGVKTSEELSAFQTVVRQVFDPSRVGMNRKAKPWRPRHKLLSLLADGFGKKERDYLEQHQYTLDAPMKWNLESALSRFGAASSTVFNLAEYKAVHYLLDFWAVDTSDTDVAPSRLPANQLKDFYRLDKDLPFAARVCDADINEAVKSLRRFRNAEREFAVAPASDLSDYARFLLPNDPRNRQIAIRRALPWGESLIVLGKTHNLTRERVRQIAKKISDTIPIRYDSTRDSAGKLHDLSAKIAAAGSSLSRSKLYDIVSSCIGKSELDEMDAILATVLLIGRSNVSDSVDIRLRQAVRLICRMPTDPNRTISDATDIRKFDRSVRRWIRRQVAHTGAIHVDDIAREVSIEPRRVRSSLALIGLLDVGGGWFSTPKILRSPKCPLTRSIAKICTAADNVQIDIAYGGIIRHARRQRFIPAPQSIVLRILSFAGINVSDTGVLSCPSALQVNFSGVERAFLEYLRKQGPVATYFDLYSEIVVRLGYSMPALSTALLRTSPIVHRVSSGSKVSLYTVRGWSVTSEDIMRATARQPAVNGEVRISHTLDGIQIRCAANTWVVSSGAISLGATEVPEGTWRAIGGASGGTVRAEYRRPFLYGLAQLIGKENIRIGEDILITFNFLERELRVTRQ